MNIVIFSRFYPPSTAISARRWGNLVAEMQKNDITCTVIASGSGKFESKTLDTGELVVLLPLLYSLPATTPNSEIGHTAKFNLKALVPKLSFALADSSLKSWIKVCWIYRKEIASRVKKADFVISTYGPSGPFLVGCWFAKRYRKLWVADLRDCFESRDVESSMFPKALSRLLETIVLRQASHRITIGSLLSEYLAGRYQMSFFPVYNGWNEEDKLDSEMTTLAVGRYFYYAGTIYEHRMQALELLICALQKHKDIRLKIRLLNKDSSAVRSLIQNCNGNGMVELLPAADSEVVRLETKGAIGMVVLEDIHASQPWVRGTVTGKLLGLLASGKRGIAIASRGGEIERLVQQASGWEFGSDESSCCSAVARILGHDSKPVECSLDCYSVATQADQLLTHLCDQA